MTQVPLSRRSFLQLGAAVGVATALGAGPAPARSAPAGPDTMMGVPFPKVDKVRIGVIGAGDRGQSIMADLLAVPGAEVPATARSSRGGSERPERGGSW